MKKSKTVREEAAQPVDYVLEDQVGFILRVVSQRHTGIFAEHMIEGLTPTQFAALAKLFEVGACSQNKLGRLTAMDAATIKGVVDRLAKRGLVESRPDRDDGRRLLVELSIEGREFVKRAFPQGAKITEATLAPLTQAERRSLLRLLRKLT